MYNNYDDMMETHAKIIQERDKEFLDYQKA